MTTPQPTNPSAILHPNSASKKSANNNVATPAGPASAPRSVPSPAAVRGSGKTPGSFKMGGTPMGFSLSGMGMSPFTPGAMSGGGAGGSNPLAGLPGYTPGSSSGGAAAAMMMMPTLSDLGLGPSASSASSSSKRTGANAEMERQRKMRGVLRRIGRTHGGVSEEAICRFSRRVGFANDVDAEGEEARRRDEGERTVGIAGKDVLIEVEMRGNRARSVVVAGLGGVGEEEREKAGKVLEGLLVGDDVDSLEGFAKELARVADLDRAGERGVSAFEAVSGVGSSLKRLYRRECEVERRDKRRVLMKRSGRPWMHSRGRIGLGVDYWTSSPSPPPRKEDDAMDLDPQEEGEEEEEEVEEDPETLSTLYLTAETCPASLYPPVRISTDWLLDEDLSTISPLPSQTDTTNDLLLPNASTTIPWQDPPPTYTSPPSEDDPPSSTTTTTTVPQSKLPDLRFLATLSPPVVLPYTTAAQILNELGGHGIPQTLVKEWHALILLSNSDAAAAAAVAVGQAPTSYKGTGLVMGRRRRGEHNDGRDVEYRWAAEISKAEWGVRITELPFAHPRMVVAILPVLRQWVVFGGFVREVLGVGGGDAALHAGEETGGGGGGEEEKKKKKKKKDGGGGGGDGGDLLDALLTSHNDILLHEAWPAREDGAEVRVTVEISTSPMPTMSFSFPLRRGGIPGGGGGGGEEEEERLARVTVQVLRNGEITVGFLEGFGDIEVVGVAERLAKGLEVCGEVGVWIEWIRGGGWQGKGKKGRGKMES